MINKYKVYKIYIPLAFWWIAMLVATTIPGDNLPKESSLLNDKVVHFFMYFGLTFFFYNFLRSFKISIQKSIPITFSIIALYALFDEWHQQFFNRSTDREDYIADIIGVIVAGIVILIIKQIKRVRKK